MHFVTSRPSSIWYSGRTLPPGNFLNLRPDSHPHLHLVGQEYRVWVEKLESCEAPCQEIFGLNLEGNLPFLYTC